MIQHPPTDPHPVQSLINEPNSYYLRTHSYYLHTITTSFHIETLPPRIPRLLGKMVSLTSKRPAAFDQEPDSPRKRHASTDIVLNKDALTLYLARTQNTLEDLVYKHNDLASKHNALALKHDKLEDEVTKVRRSPHPFGLLRSFLTYHRTRTRRSPTRKLAQPSSRESRRTKSSRSRMLFSTHPSRAPSAT